MLRKNNIDWSLLWSVIKVNRGTALAILSFGLIAAMVGGGIFYADFGDWGAMIGGGFFALIGAGIVLLSIVVTYSSIGHRSEERGVGKERRLREARYLS